MHAVFVPATANVREESVELGGGRDRGGGVQISCFNFSIGS